MDLTYITERIIAISFPDFAKNANYRNNLKDVTRMLRAKHGNKYMVFNLSERRYDLAKLNPQSLEFGWPPNLAPPLERLCSICKSLEHWLNSDPTHVAVLHSKGDKGRIGVVVAAYMYYSNISATTNQPLDRLIMKKFYDDKLATCIQPSQKRYVNYFAGLLSEAVKMNSNTLYLRQVVVHGVPNFDPKGGCRLFVKIYEGMKPIYTSSVHAATDRSRKITIPLEPSVQLRGDILVKCYHKRQKPSGRFAVFRLQFHTCTLETNRLTFSKEDLDEAIYDSRFPDDGRVEFVFSSTPDTVQGNGTVPNVIQESANDPLLRWDSYENFDLMPEDNPDDLELIMDENTGEYPLPAGTTNKLRPVPHTEGPLDGSLYATVNKKRISTNNSALGDWDSPHTISMDSGISSNSGVQGQGNSPATLLTNGSSGFPSPNTAEVEAQPPTAGDERAKLDELLDGMLRDIQSIPDPPPQTNTLTRFSNIVRNPTGRTYKYSPSVGFISVNGTKQNLNPSYNWTSDDEEDRSRPYHTQKSNAPFSYGITLDSPAIQRRRFLSDTTGNRVLDLRRVEDEVFRETSSSPEPYRIEDLNQSWLQRQQQKLRARKEGRGWEDRHSREQQLIDELRYAQHKKPLIDDGGLGTDVSSSSRENSPSKTLTSPLHINTYSGSVQNKPPIYRGTSAPSSPIIPSRSSSKDITRSRYQQWQIQSKPVTRQKSDTSFDRERPFVSVKRAHQLAKEDIAVNGTSPQHIISSSAVYGSIYPYGQPHDTQDPSGLLALLENKGSTSPSHSPTTARLDELESSLHSMSPILHSTPQHGTCQTDGQSSWSPSMVSPHSSPHGSDRPATPSFPIVPRTPYMNNDDSPTTGLPPKSPTLSRKDRSPSPATLQALRQGLGDQPAFTSNGQSSPSVYCSQSRRSSLQSLSEPGDVIHHHPVFVKDTSKYWYKPNISREDAISILKDKPPGTFVVRDSNSFPGAYGLALKVATPPPNVQTKSADISSELVRHFLVEPTAKGVRLKGCPNEPVFGSLAALVYQHSITPLALPCKLLLPDSDPAGDVQESSALLQQGAACNVLYLTSIETESLTGPQAVRKATSALLASRTLTEPTVVHFKVSAQGITLTDNNRKLFFRRHYPVTAISHCGLDPEERQWTRKNEDGIPISISRCFGFVARKPTSKTDNQCHLFAELEPEQPASAIVNFVAKVLLV